MTKFLPLFMFALSLAAFAGRADAQVNERTFKMATANPAGHPIVQGCDKFAELIAKKSNGKLTVKVFSGGVLGGDMDMLASVQGGTVDFTSMNSGLLQGLAKEFAIFDFPFLFNDGKEADAIVDGPIGKKLNDKLPPKGLIGIGFFELGFRNVTNNLRPITKLNDFQGMQLRVIQSPIYVETFQALGAKPMPMPINEVYSGLEMKVVDGQENPFSVIEANKFNKVQKYLTITNHTYNPQSVLASKASWDKLTNDEQDIILSAAKEAQQFQRKLARISSGDSLTNLKKTMSVNTLSPAELTSIRTKLKPVIDKYSEMVGPSLVNSLYAELDKFRGK